MSVSGVAQISEQEVLGVAAVGAPQVTEQEVLGVAAVGAPQVTEQEVLGTGTYSSGGAYPVADTHTSSQTLGTGVIPDAGVVVGVYSSNSVAGTGVSVAGGVADKYTSTSTPGTGVSTETQTGNTHSSAGVLGIGQHESTLDIVAHTASSASVVGAPMPGVVPIATTSVSTQTICLPVPGSPATAGTYALVQVLGTAEHYSTLDRVAETHFNGSVAGNGVPDLSVWADTHVSIGAHGAAWPSVWLPSHQTASVFPISGYRADVPHTANVTYQLQADGGVNIPAVLVYVRQRKNATTALEVHTVGRITQNQWALDLIGKELSLRQIARSMSGDIISADDLLTATVNDVVQVSGGIKVFAVKSTPPRATQHIEVADVLYIQQRSTGRRTVRCPLSWDVQAGDVISGSGLPDLKIETLTMTISRQYRIMDATEAA